MTEGIRVFHTARVQCLEFISVASKSLGLSVGQECRQRISGHGHPVDPQQQGSPHREDKVSLWGL